MTPLTKIMWTPLEAGVGMDTGATAVPMGPVECVRSNFLEITQTTSPPTFATGCHFFAGQFGKLIECSPNLFDKFTGRRREEQGREWAERGTDEEKRYRYSPHAIPIQYQYQYTIPVSDRITRGRNAIFGHVARLPDNIPAHQVMLRQVELSVGRLQTVHRNVHQVDHVPNGPTNSAAITTVFPLRVCGGKLLVAVTRERRYGPRKEEPSLDLNATRGDGVLGMAVA